MIRVPLPGLDEMSEAQRRVVDMVASGPRGRMRVGPLYAWLQSPGLAERAQELGAFCRFGTSLPARLSELAILTTAVHWQAAFEWNAHEPFALQAGLAPAVVASLRAGSTPDFTSDDEAAVHAFARELMETSDVSDPIWQHAIEILGLRGTIELIGILGYYALISMTIKACRIEPGAEDPNPLTPAGE